MGELEIRTISRTRNPEYLCCDSEKMKHQTFRFSEHLALLATVNSAFYARGEALFLKKELVPKK